MNTEVFCYYYDMGEGTSIPEVEIKSPIKNVISRARALLPNMRLSEGAVRRAEGPIESSTLGILVPDAPRTPVGEMVSASDAITRVMKAASDVDISTLGIISAIHDGKFEQVLIPTPPEGQVMSYIRHSVATNSAEFQGWCQRGSPFRDFLREASTDGETVRLYRGQGTREGRNKVLEPRVAQPYTFSPETAMHFVYSGLTLEEVRQPRSIVQRDVPIKDVVALVDPELEEVLVIERTALPSTPGAVERATDKRNRKGLEAEVVHKILEQEGFNPRDLIDEYKKSPDLKKLYESGVGVWEGYSLEQHTAMAMGQFERYFSPSWHSPIFNRDQMRIILSLHDLGKPLAVESTGSVLAQHEHTMRLVPSLLEKLGFDQRQAEIAATVIDQDYLGDYIKGAKDSIQTAEAIKSKAAQADIPIKDLMELLRVYYVCDAGSYTSDAGGVASLDRLFDFGIDDHGNNQARFAPSIQKKYEELLQRVYFS